MCLIIKSNKSKALSMGSNYNVKRRFGHPQEENPRKETGDRSVDKQYDVYYSPSPPSAR